MFNYGFNYGMFNYANRTDSASRPAEAIAKRDTAGESRVSAMTN